MRERSSESGPVSAGRQDPSAPPASPLGAGIHGDAGERAGWFAVLPGRGGAHPGLGSPGRRGYLAGLICAAVMVVAGFPLGLLWAAAAPHLNVNGALAGNESAFAVQSDIDARFGLICAVAGLIGGAVALWRARDAGWPVPLGLAAGGAAGALIAGWTGHLRRSADALHGLPANASSVLVDLVDVRVRAHGLYLVLPVTALLVFGLGLWVASLRVSSGSGRRGAAHSNRSS
ncbi:hypothetical protein MXD61_10950 [Frankia sp. AgPm24]|uniref:hypothetical protein n=1 Tax=Frankia sp. AgPm24 TaxID=631128 RepID=UPI0020101860|nr:hypothetical protein [Frankia sp. AgPm24]MCK9922388.1 hypothetical protein [Frankia sp. AgPm24]